MNRLVMTVYCAGIHSDRCQHALAWPCAPANGGDEDNHLHPFAIFLLGMAMSSDAFAAAVGKGAAMRTPRISQALRAGLIFGAIEGTLPMIGWLIGRGAADYVAAWDHWIAFTVLSLLGAHMIRAGMHAPASSGVARQAGDGFWMLAATGFATSIDALVVGAGLAFVDAPIFVVALAIGLCTFVMVTLGILLGRKLGELAGRRAEIAGGIVLFGVGCLILFDHLHPAAA